MCPSHTHCPGAASSVFILFSFIFSFWFGPFLLFPLFFLCPCRVWVRIGTRSGSKGTAEKPPGVPCCLSMDTLHVQLCPSPFPKAFSHFLGFLQGTDTVLTSLFSHRKFPWPQSPSSLALDSPRAGKFLWIYFVHSAPKPSLHDKSLDILNLTMVCCLCSVLI